MNIKIVIALVVVILLIVVGAYFMMKPSPEKSQEAVDSLANAAASSEAMPESEAKKAAEVAKANIPSGNTEAKAAGVARYIWIVARAAGIPLNLPRCRVYDANGTDIANGKPVTASSILPGYSVSTLTTETAPFSHTDSTTGQPEWMRIDLGSDQAIRNIAIWNRKDCCQDRMDGGYVLLQTSAQVTATPGPGTKKLLDNYRDGRRNYNIPISGPCSEYTEESKGVSNECYKQLWREAGCGGNPFDIPDKATWNKDKTLGTLRNDASVWYDYANNRGSGYHKGFCKDFSIPSSYIRYVRNNRNYLH